MTQLSVKRSPCPWCKSKRVRVFSWNKDTHYGECLRPSCRASGPHSKDVETALVRWNEGPVKR